MKTVYKAVNQETKEQVTPINLPTDYIPEIGHIIDTTNGAYEVIGITEVGIQRSSAAELDQSVTRVILQLQKVDQAL
ncbi:hypothetical protein DYU11_15190 [Fibrisoma montanum]|uniref:Uncharacterized protein n=1 Tax=Fibrisoma montanum TaxID=2305895 RepID=A0A418M8E2_9BACT|nr:hypothetical protein [Fibrisoma montanum]RIV22363.1 hypothetical protein DYU11_15190 [Fibrisoma montanum]